MVTKPLVYIMEYANPSACTKEEFRNSMVKAYKNSPYLVGWKNEYSPILDVTDTVRQVKGERVEKALLTIYGYTNRMAVSGPYDSKPSALSPEKIVQNWEEGNEWERQYCSKDGKWYWVRYACKLEVKYREEAPPREEYPPKEEYPPEERYPPTPFEQLLQLLRILFPFLPLQRIKR